MAEPTWLWLVLAASSALLGWAWIALAMDTHWQQVQGGPGAHGAPGAPRGGVLLLRLSGTLAVLTSAIACFAADRPSMAALVWIMLQAGAAVSVALLLASRPALLRVLWPARTVHGRSAITSISVRRDP